MPDVIRTAGEPVSRRTAMAAGVGAALGALGTAGAAGSARAAVPVRRRSHAAAPAALTARQRAGQRVIFSYSGLTVPQSLLDQIAAGHAAGVIFFKSNISSLAQIRAVTRRLQDAAQASPVRAPLLLMTDQEGGMVRRLPGGPALSQKRIGTASDPRAAAAHAGDEAGTLLAGVGMNVNLAPVLDVYRRAGDFADRYERSYSRNPAVCGRLGAAFITAQQSHGVAAAAKHFPGLGAAAAAANTDERPVTLNVSKAHLRTIDERPYTAAIQAGTRLVMASWARYPHLDAEYPAGLSPTIIQKELRGRLGFTGVTITDALSAGALKAYGTPARRAVLAARAGMDLILVTAGVGQSGQVVSGLADALTAGHLNSTAFDASVRRVTALRQGFAGG